jgi:hypothetical protein
MLGNLAFRKLSERNRKLIILMFLWNFCNVTNLYQLGQSFWLWGLLVWQCWTLWDCMS